VRLPPWLGCLVAKAESLAVAQHRGVKRPFLRRSAVVVHAIPQRPVAARSHTLPTAVTNPRLPVSRPPGQPALCNTLVSGSVGGDHADPCRDRAGQPCDHRGDPSTPRGASAPKATPAGDLVSLPQRPCDPTTIVPHWSPLRSSAAPTWTPPPNHTAAGEGRLRVPLTHDRRRRSNSSSHQQTGPGVRVGAWASPRMLSVRRGRRGPPGRGHGRLGRAARTCPARAARTSRAAARVVVGQRAALQLGPVVFSFLAECAHRGRAAAPRWPSLPLAA
jgi:hypothetical protein